MTELTGDPLGAIASGKNLLITGGPGSGKTKLLMEAFELLAGETQAQDWSPVLFLTPDRRRADLLEAQLGPGLLGKVRAPGGHRLVRGVNSYAYQVLSQWMLERNAPLPRPTLTGGADEDVWVAQWLQDNAQRWSRVVPAEAASGDALRMELRNGMARAGQRGLGSEELLDIAVRAGVPAWELLAHAYADYAGPGAVAFSAETPHLDSARIQLVAAQVLRDWDRLREPQGVRVRAPMPRTVLVDDLQDCTPATVHLLAALSASGAQVVAACSPISSTGAYRGAGPETARLLDQTLALDSISLEGIFRGDAAAQAVTAAAGQWVQPTPQGPPSPVSSSAIVLPGQGRQGAWITQQIRRHHFLEGVPWQQQAVLVRSASDIEPLRRQLARGDVPLAPTERPLQFEQIPVTRELLGLLIEEAPEDRAQSALSLLSSPLANVDRLALYRFLRDRGNPDLSHQDQVLTWMKDPPQQPADTLSAAESRVQEQLQRASRIWRRRSAAAQMSAQMGLWDLWEAAGLAQTWQDRALRAEADADRADDRLDAVLALFRRADLWEQQQMADPDGPAATGRAFAVEMLAQQVASDSISQVGIRAPGVDVLTATQAAGRQWDIVYVAGLQDGQWPSRVRPGGLLEIPRLEQVLGALPLPVLGSATGAAAAFDPGVLRTPLDDREYRTRRRKEEASLFVAAASRAAKQLYLVAVENEREAASPFLNYLVAQGVLQKFRDQEGDPLHTPVPPAFDIETLTGVLRRATVGPELSEEERRQAAALLAVMARRGVAAADPSNWVGAGGLTSVSALLGQDEQLRVGPSSLQTGKDCILQWFFRTIQGEDRLGILRPKELGAGDVGNLVHDLAEKYPDGDEAALWQAFQEQWAALGLDEEKWVVQRQKADLQTMVLNMGAHFRSVSGPVRVEQPVALDLGPVRLSGRVDRVEVRPDGSQRIVDIKTSKTSPSKAQVQDNLQLAAYQLALRDSAPVDGAALLLVHPRAAGRSPERVQPSLSDQEAAQLREELSELGQTMLGPVYPVRSVDACRSCRFRAVCPIQDEGVRSVP